MHTLSIAIMGTPLVDNGYFEDAAVEAARLKRWDFFMTVQLTKIPGGTATTFNALGIFLSLGTPEGVPYDSRHP